MVRRITGFQAEVDAAPDVEARRLAAQMLTRAQMEADPESIMSREPVVVSQFSVAAR